MSEQIKDWALSRLERFTIYICSSAVVFCSWFIWQQQQTNQKLTSMLDQIARNDARQDQAISEIKGQMVGWDTLTRIERSLGMLSAMGKGNESMSAVAEVLKTERESRSK